MILHENWTHEREGQTRAERESKTHDDATPETQFAREAFSSRKM